MEKVKERIIQLQKKHDYSELGRFHKILGSLYCEEPAPGIVLFNVAHNNYGLPTRFEGVEAVCPGPVYDEDEGTDLEWFVVTVTAYYDSINNLEDDL
jgi:hypothetical protein